MWKPTQYGSLGDRCHRATHTISIGPPANGHVSCTEYRANKKRPTTDLWTKADKRASLVHVHA